MITKDQAIALALALEYFQYRGYGNPKRTAQRHEVVSALEQAQPPAPDCRTCADYDRLEGCLRAPRYGVCTNGDQYQPAPAVVLWRTK